MRGHPGKNTPGRTRRTLPATDHFSGPGADVFLDRESVLCDGVLAGISSRTLPTFDQALLLLWTGLADLFALLYWLLDLAPLAAQRTLQRMPPTGHDDLEIPSGIGLRFTRFLP